MIDTLMPPGDFLRLLATRIERGEDVRGYVDGLSRTADIVEQHTGEWDWLPAPVLLEFEEFLERRRRERDRTAS
jgi:hypothetical protein